MQFEKELQAQDTQQERKVVPRRLQPLLFVNHILQSSSLHASGLAFPHRLYTFAGMDHRYNETRFEQFTWIDICDPQKEDLDRIASEYQLDYFQILDSLEKGHLPKFEKQEHYTFLILRAFMADPDEGITNISDLSNKMAFFYNDRQIITIHRAAFEFLKPGDIQFAAVDELLIYLVNKILESFQSPAQFLADKNDQFESEIFLKDSSRISMEDLYYLKTETRITKKLLVLMQGVINHIEVRDKYKTALQDVKDKLLSLILNYEEVLETSSNLLNTYLSVNTQKSNDVMKLLTIFSAFFLPLTFVAGIYGMNFEYMPELAYPLGYFLTLGVMAIIAIVIYTWFKRRKIIR